MVVSKDAKQTKEEFNSAKMKEVYDLLIASKDGLTAVAVGEKISVKETRMVRVFLREALKLAEKEGHKTKRDRVPGQASKIYQIVKVGTEFEAKSPIESQGSGNDALKGKASAAASKTVTVKK